MPERRILHLNDQVGWGGGENQTWALISELERLGQCNHALVREGSELQRRLRSLLPRERLHSLPGWQWPLARWKVATLRSQVDLVHAHTGRTTLAAIGSRSLPWVAHRRIPDAPSPSGLQRLAKASLVLCVSHEIQRRLADLSWPAPGAPRLETVPSCAQWPEKSPAPQPLAGAPVLGFMGHFRRHKGLDLLLAALPAVHASWPKLHLHLAGEGPEEGRLRELVRTLRLEPLVSFSPLPEATAEFISALDLFIMPSREEGLGSVALLAQALGVPVLATQVGGIPEGVRHGETGWLVQPEDVPALAAGLRLLLDDPALRQRLGAAGPAWVRENFSPEIMARRTLAFYNEVLAGKQAGSTA